MKEHLKLYLNTLVDRTIKYLGEIIEKPSFLKSKKPMESTHRLNFQDYKYDLEGINILIKYFA